MPEITAYAKIFRHWEGLIGACLRNASLLVGVEPLREGLEAILARAREAKLQQENLTSSRLATTQSLQEMLADGRELARKIRYFAQVQLGSRSELLTAFGATPIRTKLRKTRPTQVTTPDGSPTLGAPAVNPPVANPPQPTPQPATPQGPPAAEPGEGGAA